MKQEIIIINNEKCKKKDSLFYCENLEMKSLPESLNKKFDIHLILRESQINNTHKIELKNINISSNIFGFLFNIFKTFKKNKAIYLVISVTPYTFISFFLLFLFRKKIFLYLRSDGKKEIKIVFGKILSYFYRLAEFLMSKYSELIVVNDRILKNKKYNLVSPSQINEIWTKGTSYPDLSRIKLLYVGRIKIEKGVNSLAGLFNRIKSNNSMSLSLVGNGKGDDYSNESINFLGPISKKEILIKQYDEHNIFVLPSFTEGHPQVLIESLTRKRPVIIFDEIKHVKKNYKGVFVCNRNSEDFLATIKYIIKNYKEIFHSMNYNNIPTQKEFILQLERIFLPTVSKS